MSRSVVLAYRELPPDQLARLRAEHEVIQADPFLPGQEAAFFEALGRASGMIGALYPVGADLLARAPALRVVSSISVGVDAYDQEALAERDIVLCHTPRVLDETVADLLMGMVLAMGRRIHELADHVRAGQWDGNVGPALFGWDVHGKTLGVLGYGRIGHAVARRAALGFGMPVLYCARSPRDSGLPEGAARQVPLPELLSESDFLVVVLPLSGETRGLLGEAEFARMKPGAFLINGGRGAVLQEDALIRALDEGKLRGAALDVFATEPLPLDSPLRTHPKVLPLPHVGSATHETRHAMAEMATSNLLMALRGETPLAAYPLRRRS